MSKTYLARQNCGYLFRIRIPNDLQPVVGKGELRYSLATGSLRKAKFKTKKISRKVKQLFRKLREVNHNLTGPKLTKMQIAELIRGYVEQSIADAEDMRATTRVPMTPDEHDVHLDALRFEISDTREALGLGNLRVVRDDVIRLLDSKGFQLDSNSDDFLRLSHEMLKAKLKLLEIERMQILRNYSYQAVDIAGTLGVISRQPEKQSEPLSVIFGAYWKENVSNWKPRSQVQYKGIEEFILDISFFFIFYIVVKILISQLLCHLIPKLSDNHSY